MGATAADCESLRVAGEAVNTVATHRLAISKLSALSPSSLFRKASVI